MSYSHGKVKTIPISNHRFIVNIEGAPNALNFSSISEIRESTEITEIRECSKPFSVTKVVGVTHYSPVTLSRAFTLNSDLLEEWRDQVRSYGKDSKNAMRTVIISILNNSKEFFKKIVLEKAWPSGYTIGAMDALSPQILMETIELQFEKLTIENYGGASSGGSSAGQILIN